MGLFDALPFPRDKEYLREDLEKVDESWTVARFDSLPHVVHILTSKDREAEVNALKDQSDIVEDVVDEVVQAYHSGFNRAIQNYSNILRFFSDSTQSIGILKVDLAKAKRVISARNKQLHQLWYRSMTLRHVISLLEQIENIAKVPARIDKLIAEKQFYAAVQLHVQSARMLEREGLQSVGALQDVRSELTKMRGILFNKVLEDLHAHLYNNGAYSPATSSKMEKDDAIPTTTADAQSVSRKTRLLKGESNLIDGGSSYNGRHENGTLDVHEETASDGHTSSTNSKVSHEIPAWLSDSTPDEFVEAMRKSDSPPHVKYLQTMVECLCMLRKVAAAGTIICQRLRPTVHEIITTVIRTQAEHVNSSRPGIGQAARTSTTGPHCIKGKLHGYQLPKNKHQNGISLAVTLSAVSPVSPVLSPTGKAQAAAKELLHSILDAVVRIFENHVIVGEVLEAKSSQQIEMNTPKSLVEITWNPDSEASRDTGGYSIGFSMTVLQSECQQLICEILRSTPEAASADAAAQTAKLASKGRSKDKRDQSEGGLTFTFRFTDATLSVHNQGRHKKGSNQEGYGSATLLPEQGMYLAASVYRPVIQFTDKIASMLPQKYSHLGNDGLLAYVEKFVKDHFLPTIFVDYRKGVQQAISSPAAFRPRAHAVGAYTSSIAKGRPILQGLLTIDFLAKEVLGWAQAMPKFSGDLVKYVQTFLERTYEKCRTSYTEAVLEKQSYMLIGRHDMEKLMRLDPASAFLPSSLGQANVDSYISDAEALGIEKEISVLMMNLRPIKQEFLIRDNNKLILLASLSDSLEYIADSIERLGGASTRTSEQVDDIVKPKTPDHKRSSSVTVKDLPSFAEDYRKLAIDCLKVLRVEMQLETVFHMQGMASREYLEEQDTEEPDDFIVALTTQITRRDEDLAPYIALTKRKYIFGGICGVASNASIKALAEMKRINLFGVQQICKNTIALEQALSAIPSIGSESVQTRLTRIRTYYELLNMPFEALLAFITEHNSLFTASEYARLLKIQIPGREMPEDAQDRVADVLPC